MKVLSCAAIAIATITITIAKMHNANKEVIVTDEDSTGVDKPFWAPIPKHISKKLNVGDMITLVCVPVAGFKFATETLAVKKITGERTTEIIYDRGSYSNYLSII